MFVALRLFRSVSVPRWYRSRMLCSRPEPSSGKWCTFLCSILRALVGVLRSRGWANYTRPVWGNAGLSFLRYLCSALLVWLRVSSAFFAVEMNPWSSCSCFQSVIGIIYNNMNIFHDGTESIMFLNVYLYWGSRTQFVGAIHIYIVSCVIRPFYSCVRLLYLWGGTEHTWWKWPSLKCPPF